VNRQSLAAFNHKKLHPEKNTIILL
jgi:hypothetical protein